MRTPSTIIAKGLRDKTACALSGIDDTGTITPETNIASIIKLPTIILRSGKKGMNVDSDNMYAKIIVIVTNNHTRRGIIPTRFNLFFK
ncbi:hypothetical protein MAH1_35080 [Sessilibacter sp. MAH1]